MTMSGHDHRMPTTKATPVATLESGDRLSGPEFEDRYRAHPEIERAELIEGVVFVSPPVGAQHADPHAHAMGWLFIYAAATPGLRPSDNISLRLDAWNVVQPDASLRIAPGLGGRSRLSSEGLLEGAPELVVEVAASSASIDLREKREILADGSGRLPSRVFPGLWLDPGAFWKEDLSAVATTVREGLATPEHARFVDELRRRAQGDERRS